MIFLRKWITMPLDEQMVCAIVLLVNCIRGTSLILILISQERIETRNSNLSTKDFTNMIYFKRSQIFHFIESRSNLQPKIVIPLITI